MKKPFEAKKKLFQRMEQHLDATIDKVVNLAKEPERMKEVDMAKPSMLGTVAEPEFQYWAEAFEAAITDIGNTIAKSEAKQSEMIKGKIR